jgi:hypothetical protein
MWQGLDFSLRIKTLIAIQIGVTENHRCPSSTPPDSFVKTVGNDIDKKTTKKQVKYQTVDVHPWV